MASALQGRRQLWYSRGHGSSAPPHRTSSCLLCCRGAVAPAQRLQVKAFLSQTSADAWLPSSVSCLLSIHCCIGRKQAGISRCKMTNVELQMLAKKCISVVNLCLGWKNCCKLFCLS